MPSSISNGAVHCVASLAECQRALDGHRVVRWMDNAKFGLNRLGTAFVNLSLQALTRIFFAGAERLGDRLQDVLVYLAGTVGDVTVRLPVLVALRRKYPRARLAVLLAGNPDLRMQFFPHLPYVDRMEDLSGDSLRAMRCDLFVNLSGSGQIGWLRYQIREMRYARRLGASAVMGFGISTLGVNRWFSTFQDRCLKNEPEWHLALARWVHDTPIRADDILPPDAQARRATLSTLKLRDNESFAVLVPGASKVIKRWPPEHFAAIADRLHRELKLKVVVIGTPSETGLTGKIASLSHGAAVDAGGRLELWDVVELLRMAKLCLTNDTGPLHIATTLGIPTVAVFSSSVPPTWWFPHGDNVRVLFSLRVCSQCFASECGHVDCLLDVTADDVWNAIVELWNADPERRME